MDPITEQYNRYKENQKTGELLTFTEWRLIELSEATYRDFESPVFKYTKYGLAALLGLGILSKLTVGLYRLYRMSSDVCVKRCGGVKYVNRRCYNTCYMQACQQVLNRIRSDVGQLPQIEDPIERKKVERRLKKLYKTWKSRYDTYKLRAETAPREVVLSRGKRKKSK